MINVVDLIYKQMEKENAPRERKLRHYPSSLPYYDEGVPAGKCKRALAYAMLGVEITHPIDPVALFKMDMGNMIHDKVDDILNRALKDKYGDAFNIEDELLQEYIESYNLLNPESPIKKTAGEVPMVWAHDGLEFPFSGRIDKIISIEGKRGLGEWKSTYGYGANMIKKEGPKLEALLQARTYLDNPYIPLDFITLVYIARDSGYMFGYYIEMDGDKLICHHMSSGKVDVRRIDLNMIVKACQEVEQHVNAETLPEKDYQGFVNSKTNTLTKASAWQCRYCSYRGLCYGVDD